MHSMVTNDIESLTPGRGCRAVMLTVKGKTLAEMVVRCEEESLELELDAALAEKIRGVIEKHVIMDDVEVSRVEGREWGVWGEGARLPALEPYCFTSVSGVRVAATPELTLPGWLVYGELPF